MLSSVLPVRDSLLLSISPHSHHLRLSYSSSPPRPRVLQDRSSPSRDRSRVRRSPLSLFAPSLSPSGSRPALDRPARTRLTVCSAIELSTKPSTCSRGHLHSPTEYCLNQISKENSPLVRSNELSWMGHAADNDCEGSP